MPLVLHKMLKILITILLLVTCTSCSKDNNQYTKNSWLKDLAYQAGIITSKDIDDKTLRKELINWEVIKEKDNYKVDSPLDFEFLAYSLSNLLGDSLKEADYPYETKYKQEIANFISYKLIDDIYHPNDYISYFEADEILKKALKIINNQEFEPVSEIEYTKPIFKYQDIYEEGNYYFDSNINVGDIIEGQNNYYQVTKCDGNNCEIKEANIEDLIEKIKFADTMIVDFDNAYIEDYYESYQEPSIYDDQEFKRQASLNFSKSFNINGYKVSYSVNMHKLHLHISKKTDRGINVYYDGDIYDIKPSFKWDYEKGLIKDAYFRVDFKANNEFGLSVGKYKNLYGDFNRDDKENIFNHLKNFLKPKDDVVDTSFTICKIHTPIPQIPFLEFTIELKVNIYASGKVEIVFDGNYNTGLEIRNNNMRVIFDNHHDIDTNIRASSSATTSLIFALALMNQDLVNFRTNFGAKAEVLSTIHLYDDKGQIKSEKAGADYDLLNEYEDNHEIFVCGDLSLSWILNLVLNSKNSLAAQLGLSKRMDILDEDDQIFNNKTHIENGSFVDQCTRKNKTNISNNQNENTNVNPDRIILDQYSIVLKTSKQQINIISLPNNYNLKDLCFESSNPDVVLVDSNGILSKQKVGVSKIRIYTSDNKYEIFLNVLVSDESN